MEGNPDSIDKFLESMGLKVGGPELTDKVEEPSEKQSDVHSVKVQIHSLTSARETQYYLHSYILGRVNESDLKGQPFDGSISLQIDGKTLKEVCAKIEQSLSLFYVHSRRDPPEGLLGPGHVNASYELLNRLDDPHGRTTYRNTMRILNKIALDYQRGV